MSFQPPRFLFGWAMVSNRMGHDVVRRSRPNSDAPLPYTNYQGESVVLTESLRSRFPLIMDQLGWVIIDCVWIHGKGAFTCIALADSWATGSRKPTADQIVTLRDFFGIGKGDIQALDNEPMWWMDLNSQCWQYACRRECLRDYRPWDLERRVPVRA
jgi:Lon-like ATP-dependent protease